MSRLYSNVLYTTLKGSRAERTCRGHNEMHAHIRGWESGIRILAGSSKERGEFFRVYRTTGSNGNSRDDQLIYELNGEQGSHCAP